jgi:hypothetical protein
MNSSALLTYVPFQGKVNMKCSQKLVKVAAVKADR